MPGPGSPLGRGAAECRVYRVPLSASGILADVNLDIMLSSLTKPGGFNDANFRELFYPLTVAAAALLVVAIVFYNVQVRRFHRHAPLLALQEWVKTNPVAPAGDWYKDFGSFMLCGSGQFPKTVLEKGMKPFGDPVE